MAIPSVWTEQRVAEFLVSIGVDESDADSAAAALLTAGYKTETYLLSAKSDHLEKANIPFPVIDVILAHQEKAKNLQNENTLERIEKKLDDMATVDIPMSEATINFTSSFLDYMRIKYVVCMVNTETGEGKMEKYPWGEKEHEADGQPGCKRILEEEILPLAVSGESLSLYDVRNRSLPELKAGKRKSNGFSDLGLGPEESMNYAVTHARDLVLSYTDALVELKTEKADLKLGQLLLQLVSLAFVSGRGQGVVVLGTDCVNKWRLLHFSGHNSIVVQPYAQGKRCLADFKTLIAECTARMKKMSPQQN